MVSNFKESDSPLKIITVNIHESQIEAINKLVSPTGLFSSRSELIRGAVERKLKREIEMVKNMAKYNDVEFEDIKVKEFDDKNFVRVPVTTKNDKNEDVKTFKTYKILKRLEF